MAGWKGAVATLMVSAGLACALASQAAAATPGYVALGDSFASGDGTKVYYHDGTRCRGAVMDGVPASDGLD